MQIRVMDMFCGAGGSSAGARWNGAEVIHGVDAWDLAARTFRDNFETAAVDIRELGPESQPPRALQRGDIDLLLASPECTNHSNAKGAKPRCEDSRRTSYYVFNFAKRLRPRWIVLENVVQIRNWHGFENLIRDLRNLGYHIRLETLDAVDFGVPQTRRRLFVLCDLDHEPPRILPRSRRQRTAEEAIQLGGKWPSKPLRIPGRARPTIERAERAIARLGRGRPFLIVYYGTDGTDGMGGWQSLTRPLRTITTLDRFGLVTWEGQEPMLRMLQVDELRRAMGFSNIHRFEHGVRRDKIKMIGNSVCPPVMGAIIESMTGCRLPVTGSFRTTDVTRRRLSPTAP
jgi:DNA (cytosine-5)-methyltransferase 1